MAPLFQRVSRLGGRASVRSWRLTPRLTAARRPGRNAKLLYPDHRPSPDLLEADGAAVAVEPVVRRPYPIDSESSLAFAEETPPTLRRVHRKNEFGMAPQTPRKRRRSIGWSH